MTRGTPHLMRTLVLVLVALFQAPAVRAQISPACDGHCAAQFPLEQCALGDASCELRNLARVGDIAQCEAEEMACEGKLTSYRAYMANMSAGAQEHELPALYQEILGPQYSASLANHRFGFSSKQEAGIATTDCSRSYYHSQSVVAALADGTVSGSGDWKWLLHELAHVEQCDQAGGRDEYALMWWDQVGQVDPGFGETPLEDLWWEMHPQMPMEVAANQRRDQVWNAIDACCINGVGRMVRPLSIDNVAQSAAGASQAVRIFAAQTSGGSLPLEYQWYVRRPGDGDFQPATGADGIGTEAHTFSWAGGAPDEYGTFAFKVEVGQSRSSLPTEESTVTYEVVAPAVSHLDLDRTRVDRGGVVVATVRAMNLLDSESKTVQLSSDHSAWLTMPESVTVTGSAPVTVEIGVQTGTADGSQLIPWKESDQVEIRADLLGSSRTATFEVRGYDFTRNVNLEPDLVEVARDHLFPEETARFKLRLRSPAPYDLTVRLSSSDPGVLTLPASVVIRKGETEMTVEGRIARDVRSPVELTVDVALEGREVATSARLQVRPRSRSR